MAEKGKILSGARMRFSLNGVKIGYATGVEISENINYQAVECLDNVEVEEYVPVGYTVERFTASKMKIVGETLKSQGFFPSVGNNTSDHLLNILTTGELKAIIEDVKTGTIVATVEQVKVASQNYRIEARNVVGEDVTFNAIRIRDESEI